MDEQTCDQRTDTSSKISNTTHLALELLLTINWKDGIKGPMSSPAVAGTSVKDEVYRIMFPVLAQYSEGPL